MQIVSVGSLLWKTVCMKCQSQFSGNKNKLLQYIHRVDYHVLFNMIHCTEIWRNFDESLILSGGKQHFINVCSVLSRD